MPPALVSGTSCHPGREGREGGRDGGEGGREGGEGGREGVCVGGGERQVR